jgi:hypothetical protein
LFSLIGFVSLLLLSLLPNFLGNEHEGLAFLELKKQKKNMGWMRVNGMS